MGFRRPRPRPGMGVHVLRWQRVPARALQLLRITTAGQKLLGECGFLLAVVFCRFQPISFHFVSAGHYFPPTQSCNRYHSAMWRLVDVVEHAIVLWKNNRENLRWAWCHHSSRHSEVPLSLGLGASAPRWTSRFGRNPKPAGRQPT